MTYHNNPQAVQYAPATSAQATPTWSHQQQTQAQVPQYQAAPQYVAQPPAQQTVAVASAPVLSPSPTSLGYKLYRKVLDPKKTTKLPNGDVVPAWIPDPKRAGGYLEQPVQFAEQAQAGDSIIVFGFGDMMNSNPTLALQKLDMLSAALPAGPNGEELRINPVKTAVPYPQLGGRRACLNQKGNWIGFVGEVTLGDTARI